MLVVHCTQYYNSVHIYASYDFHSKIIDNGSAAVQAKSDLTKRTMCTLAASKRLHCAHNHMQFEMQDKRSK